MRVVCVGDCGVDHYLPSGELLVGGITANFARHARHVFPAGDEISIVSCVGSDPGADLVLSSLEGSQIDCQITRLPGTTPVQYIRIEPDGERSFVRYEEGVLRDFRFSEQQRQIIAASDLMVAPVYLQIAGLFDDLMSVSTRGKVAIDFADILQHPDVSLLEEHIDRIDIGFFGLATENAETATRIGELAARHSKLFVVTLGADGCHVYRGSERFETRAVPVNAVIDTTGAGDAFAAGFLSRYCHGASVPASAAYGATLAARVIGYIGSYRPD